jgi:hypothetical protein
MCVCLVPITSESTDMFTYNFVLVACYGKLPYLCNFFSICKVKSACKAGAKAQAMDARGGTFFDKALH